MSRRHTSGLQPVKAPADCIHALTIRHIIENHAGRAPDGIAMMAPDRVPLTYGRLRTHIDDVVGTLNSVGLGRGDRVAIVLSNGPEMATAFLAVAAGTTSAPLNPAYSAREFDFYLSDLNAKALIVQSGIDSPAVSVARERGIPVLELSAVLEAAAGTVTVRGHDP